MDGQRIFWVIIDDERRYIFVHVPKTAGNAIHKSLPRPRRNPWKMHRALFQIAPENRIGKFAFGFVRNPWDRMVSLYHFCVQKHEPRNINQASLISNGFEKSLLTNTIDSGQRDAMWYLDGCDCIGRFERLQDDFDGICDILGVEHRTVGKINASKHDDYRTYYTPEMIDHVAEKHKRTIELFGYTFE